MCLHHGCITIDVNDKAWQEVALSMNQSIGVSLRIVSQTDRKSHVERRLKTRFPELVVDFYFVEGQYTHSDRSLLIVSYSDKITIFCYHSHHFSLFNAIVSMVNSTRENPWMKTQKAFFFASFQIYFIHCSVLL